VKLGWGFVGDRPFPRSETGFTGGGHEDVVLAFLKGESGGELPGRIGEKVFFVDGDIGAGSGGAGNGDPWSGDDRVILR